MGIKDLLTIFSPAKAQSSPDQSINESVAKVKEDCGCYVQFMDNEVVFQVRWGAHGLDCPLYRQSRDPVDHVADLEFRAKFEPMVNRHQAILNPE